jgi:hypothetical protein
MTTLLQVSVHICSISRSSLRAVMVIAAVIAGAVNDRTNECVYKPTLTWPAFNSLLKSWLRNGWRRCVAISGLDLLKWHLEVPRLFAIRQF